MSEKIQVAINVQPVTNETTLIMLSVLFEVINKSFMVLKFMFKI